MSRYEGKGPKLWASRGKKVKNVKMRKGREGTKTIDKKCQQDQKLRTIEKKQENQKIYMIDEMGNAILTMVDNVHNSRQH